MYGVLVALLSLLLLPASAVGVHEYRSYTPEQRVKAPVLSRLYLAGMVLVGVVALASLAWVGTGRTVPWGVFPALSALGLAVVLVQNRMHRWMGVDRSPMMERFEDRFT